MWIKKIPGIAVNVAVLILNVFAILMIVGLFLHQGTTGERVKETITRFSTTSQEYYPGAYVFGGRNKVIIQSPISIPLTLHLDVACRHMKFQKKLLIHASMIRNFFFHFAWL